MAAYATQADFEAYVEGWVTDNADALGRLLERASRDIDALMGPRGPILSGAYTGFKFDPTTLAATDRKALADATCAQAEFRFDQGEVAFAGYGVGGRVSGPDFAYDAPSPAAGGAVHVGPKVRAELMRINHLRTLFATAR